MRLTVCHWRSTRRRLSLKRTPSTLEEYQALYQSERKELLKRRGKLAEDHPSVTVTFSLAFKKVADDNPAAADLLRVCAFLEADSIPEEIFSEGAKELGEALGSVAESPLGLSDAIEEAGRFSLLRRNPETRYTEPSSPGASSAQR